MIKQPRNNTIFPFQNHRIKGTAYINKQHPTFPAPPSPSCPLKHPSHSLKYICFLIDSKLLTLHLDYEMYEATI